jgi:DNA invertase Pin-like site-specific DNA recombinase
MSENHSTIRAALYCRRSTKNQEDSIDRQLDSCRPYAAKKGYVVVGKPYVDDGICGDEFEKRKAFQRLLADAKRGLFHVIVCDEWSRISRQKVLAFMATVAHPLDQCGVTLDTVADGECSWDDIGDLIVATVRADKSSGESVTKSHRVAGEYLKLMREGRLLGGPTPYGLLVVREPDPKKPGRMRPVRYEPDPRTAHVVRWIFERFSAGAMSLLDLARELNERRSPPPAKAGGNRKEGTPVWTRGAVRVILRNPKYTGAYCWNRQGNSKYHSVRGDGVKKHHRNGHRGPKPVEDWYVTPDAFEPLVSQDVFDLCQERLDANRGGRLQSQAGTFLFSKLVVCERCGRTLVAKKARGRRVYSCSKTDDAKNERCGWSAVREDYLLDQVLRVLREQLLDPDYLDELRRQARQDDDRERSDDLRQSRVARLAELEKNIRQGNANLAILPPDRIPAVLDVLRGMETERDTLQGELAHPQGESHADRLEAVVKERERMLWALEEARDKADPLVLRRAVRAFVDRVEVQFTAQRQGKKTRHRVTGGVIHLKGEAHRDQHGSW